MLYATEWGDPHADEITYTPSEEECESTPSDDKPRSYANGGRKRSSASVGQFLTSMYLTGRMSAADVQEGSSAAKKKGSSEELVSEFARCGKTGPTQEIFIGM